VRVRTFAPHFVKAPAFTVSFVAILLHEVPCIKVRTPGAVFVDIAVECELRTALIVGLGECPSAAYWSTTPSNVYGFGGHPGMLMMSD